MKNITLSLIYNSFEMVADWWNYQNVISPFNRIYFITEGEGWVQFNNTNYHLTPGKLFLIPKFTFHNYRCNDKTLYSFTSHRHLIKTSGIIELQGIIYQLVSRFISDCPSPHSNTQKKRLSKITHYVQQNLHKNWL